MIEVHLFGHLREYAIDPLPGPGTVMQVAGFQLTETGANKNGTTVGQMLSWLDIDPDQVGNLFLNGRLLPRSTYPILLGYPLAAERALALDEYLDALVQEGDRVAIFPRNMSSVVV